MTNLIAAIVVTLSTNSVTTNNATPPGCCYARGFTGPDQVTPEMPFGFNTIPGKPATEQVETFTVTRITESVVKLEGQTFRQTLRVEPVESWQVKYVPSAPWKAVSTNLISASTK